MRMKVGQTLKTVRIVTYASHHLSSYQLRLGRLKNRELRPLMKRHYKAWGRVCDTIMSKLSLVLLLSCVRRCISWSEKSGDWCGYHMDWVGWGRSEIEAMGMLKDSRSLSMPGDAQVNSVIMIKSLSKSLIRLNHLFALLATFSSLQQICTRALRSRWWYSANHQQHRYCSHTWLPSRFHYAL